MQIPFGETLLLMFVEMRYLKYSGYVDYFAINRTYMIFRWKVSVLLFIYVKYG